MHSFCPSGNRLRRIMTDTQVARRSIDIIHTQILSPSGLSGKLHALGFGLDLRPARALDSALDPVDTHSISSLKSAVATTRVEARVPGQIDSLARKETRDGKPFFELSLADAEGKLTLRAWSDSPAFSLCEGLAAGDFVEVSGEFGHSAAYGVESKRWTCAPLSQADRLSAFPRR